MSDMSMRKVLKGVVVDHRVPNTQLGLVTTSNYDKQKFRMLSGYIKHRFVTHPYFTLPAVIIVGSTAFFSFAMLYKAYVLGKFLKDFLKFPLI